MPATLPPPGGEIRNLDGHLRTLKVVPIDTPTMRVKVTAGVYWRNGTEYAEVPEQLTGSFVAPSQGRIDVVVLDVTSTHNIKAGTDSATPSVPDIDLEQVPIALIVLYPGMTEITDDDIWDARDVAGPSVFSFNHNLLTGRNAPGAHTQGSIAGLNTNLNNKADKVGTSDIEITDSSKGIILKSPGGTRYRVTVDNSGNLVVTPA